MDNETQANIIDGIVNGDENIILAFYEEYLPQVTSFIMKNSGTLSDSKDVFQDAMVLVYQKLEEGSLKLDVPLGAYVYGVCRNLWRNRLRKKQKMVVSDDLISITGIDDSNFIEDIQRNEREAVYQKYFLKLGSTCQEILSAFFLGNSMKEIAKQRKTTHTYIRSKKYQCKKKLIEMIKKDVMYNEIKTISK